MALTSNADPDAAAEKPRSFWRRRLIDPLREQLTRGVTPDRLAFTVGVGTVCSVFPLLGFTTLMNVGAGIAFRLNHAILQTLNQVLGLFQLALILVYVRIGEVLWGSEATSFAVTEVVRVFREESLGTFFQQFGWAGVHAFTAWLVTTPLVVGVIYVSLRPVFRRLSRKIKS